MKKIRLIVTKWYFVLPLALVMFMESCSKDAVAEAKYSGQELFEGVFFAKGEVGDKVSAFTSNYEIYTSNESEVQQLGKAQDEIVAYISTTHPEFFASFKENIQSGNVALVKSSMISASKYICEALKVDFAKVQKTITKENISELRAEMIKNKSLDPKAKVAALESSKYREVLKKMYLGNTTSATPSKEVAALAPVGSSVESYLSIYFSVAAVVAAVFVLVVVVGAVAEETPAEIASLQTDTTEDALYREQMFATIATNLAVK